MILKLDNYWLELKLQQQIDDLIQQYQTKGTIKKYEIDEFCTDFDELEWMQKKSIAYSNMDKLL